MKVDEFLTHRLRTARVNDDDARRIKASLRAAGFASDVPDHEVGLADEVLTRALKRASSYATSAPCPRCQGGMVGVRLATEKPGNYCTACRVSRLRERKQRL